MLRLDSSRIAILLHGRRGVSVAAVACAFAASPAVAAPVITDPGQGPVLIADPSATGASQLSGLAYPSPGLFPLPGGLGGGGGVGGLNFTAVSDTADEAAELAVAIDPATGLIAAASIVGRQTITGGGSDLEGIALTFAPGTADVSAAVVSEGAGTIKLFSIPDVPGTGVAANAYPNIDFTAPTASVAVPAIYSTSRPNLGLESLAFAAGTGPNAAALYTANEESLTPDLASGRVRLQRFDPGGGAGGFTAGRQVAYTLESTTGDFIAVAANGVSDLLALPDGSLLVLERTLGATPQFQLKTRTTISLITAADFASADDTSALAALTGTEAATGKSVIFQRFYSDQNYEGIALGESLDPAVFGPNAYSLLLISDNGQLTSGPATFSPQQSLLPLVIQGVQVPEPATAATMLLGLLTTLLRRGSGAAAPR